MDSVSAEETRAAGGTDMLVETNVGKRVGDSERTVFTVDVTTSSGVTVSGSIRPLTSSGFCSADTFGADSEVEAALQATEIMASKMRKIVFHLW